MKIGNINVVGLTPEGETFLLKRAAFVEKYCKERNLDPKTMTIAQVLELRKEEGWKNPQ